MVGRFKGRTGLRVDPGDMKGIWGDLGGRAS